MIGVSSISAGSVSLGWVSGHTGPRLGCIRVSLCVKWLPALSRALPQITSTRLCCGIPLGAPHLQSLWTFVWGCVPSRCDLASISGLYTSSSSSQVLALWGHLLIPETSLKPVVCMLAPPGLPACWGHPLMRLCHPPFSSVSYTTSLTLPPPTLLQQLLATELLRAPTVF